MLIRAHDSPPIPVLPQFILAVQIWDSFSNYCRVQLLYIVVGLAYQPVRSLSIHSRNPRFPSPKALPGHAFLIAASHIRCKLSSALV